MVFCRVGVLSGRAVIRSTKFLNLSCSGSYNTVTRRVFSSNSASPSDRFYTAKHEWVLVNGDVGTVGISQYAQESLGDVVFAQLPDIGATIKRNEECGALESVKAASELYSPITGTVLEKNTTVEDTPSIINESCYDKGWLFKLKIAKPDEISALMTAKQYNEFCAKDTD